MANLLILDASSALCSVSLLTDQGNFHVCEDQPRRHAQRLLPMVDEILQQSGLQKHQLNGIAYGRGPGSFTGIRIAASVMQGIALALNIPVYGCSSLQAVAQEVAETEPLPASQKIAVIMDAHMGEVFWGIFQCDENGMMQPQGHEQVSTPEVCIEALTDFDGLLVGDGLALTSMSALTADNSCVQPKTEYMARLVQVAWENNEFGSEEQHQPVYLRDSVAWKKLDEQPSLLKRS
ncbi:tRNA (adenosine(37)-N6)-threonylcarbamoyltransferase complex dimerization subunit type 1 TsaB [Bacterioplanoides sp.]|uniref:tRNA (adenosine(37)-N6)-threonylcarbamoyltransferase complex dimerization subunit type 1 TsaB n=1 Tax=Bacterioplanoides sp. TaxID=2066072 RepID=UPI003B00DF7B